MTYFLRRRLQRNTRNTRTFTVHLICFPLNYLLIGYSYFMFLNFASQPNNSRRYLNIIAITISTILIICIIFPLIFLIIFILFTNLFPIIPRSIVFILSLLCVTILACIDCFSSQMSYEKLRIDSLSF